MLDRFDQMAAENGMMKREINHMKQVSYKKGLLHHTAVVADHKIITVSVVLDRHILQVT